jgi:hypothetical protein
VTRSLGRRFLALVIMTAVCPLVAQNPPPVPPPTLENEIYGSLPAPRGDFKVGRVTVHWIDTSRIEPLPTDRKAFSPEAQRCATYADGKPMAQLRHRRF